MRAQPTHGVTFHPGLDFDEKRIDFDYGDEEMMSRLSGVGRDAEDNPVFRVGQASYRTVLVGNMETMRRYGLVELVPGQTVLVRYGPGPKGLMAAEIHLEQDVAATVAH